jgi:hypothetical protein
MFLELSPLEESGLLFHGAGIRCPALDYLYCINERGRVAFTGS